MQYVMDLWEASTWALTEFGRAELGHRARTKRLVQMASALIQAPAASIPKAITDPAQAKAGYRFLSNPKVTAEGILERVQQRLRGFVGCERARHVVDKGQTNPCFAACDRALIVFG
jgi:hypothetical protein